jgi:peptide/nickel transport system substrate-binding protein
VIDAPGPWGTRPFTLVEGYSSLRNEIALVNANPFVCMWLTTDMPRTDKVVLEANRDHWNRERGPRVERVVFHIDTETAVGMVCDGEGEVDIVTDLTAEQAARVVDSEHAQLAVVDALRIVVGCINRDVKPLDDVRGRKALNMAIDRATICQDVFGGYAEPLVGMTPPYCKGRAQDAEPYPFDPDQAKQMFAEAGWPEDRPLRLGSTPDLAGLDEVIRQQLADSLGITVELTTIAKENLQAAQHVLVEKTIELPFDVLLYRDRSVGVRRSAQHLHRCAEGAVRREPPRQLPGARGNLRTGRDGGQRGALVPPLARTLIGT